MRLLNMVPFIFWYLNQAFQKTKRFKPASWQNLSLILHATEYFLPHSLIIFLAELGVAGDAECAAEVSSSLQQPCGPHTHVQYSVLAWRIAHRHAYFPFSGFNGVSVSSAVMINNKSSRAEAVLSSSSSTQLSSALSSSATACYPCSQLRLLSKWTSLPRHTQCGAVC